MDTHTELGRGAGGDIAIEIAQVTRSFGEVNALDGVSFTVAKDSICGLLGSNGAGKTTLMALIAGHDRPSTGSLTVLGQNPFESEQVAAATSFIRDNQRYPDDYKLIHVLRIAKEFHANWDDKFAQQLVEEFRIPAKTQVKKFSRGQLSALSIVIAMAARAPITIFDEPYLGLDVASRHRFYELLMQDYAAYPRTIIVSTHLVGEMETMFDHAVILELGKVVLNSPIEELAGIAYRVSGRTEHVKMFAGSKNVLSTRTLGAMAVCVIQEPLTAGAKALAEVDGLILEPVSLQELVGALGSQSAAESTNGVAA